MTQLDRIRAAWALLSVETPLKRDCGAVCGAACCQPDEDGRGGMILFPGEEALYDPCPAWATLAETPIEIQGRPLLFLACDGRCPRDSRPLACRIFPLTFTAVGQGVAVALDARAWPVCPLMPSGMNGLSGAFAAAVRAAAGVLWADEGCRAYIKLLTSQAESYKFLG